MSQDRTGPERAQDYTRGRKVCAQALLRQAAMPSAMGDTRG
jgi:hypothetical protein